MIKTQNLDLFLLQYNQAQKELVSNEWFSTIDALFFRYVFSFIDTLPDDVAGVYIVSDKAQGSLAQYSNCLAWYLNGWRYLSPKDGFIFFVRAYSNYFIFENGVWRKHLYDIKRIDHNGGDLILDTSLFSEFEINAHSNLKIGILSSNGLGNNFKIKIFAEEKLEVKWFDSVAFSDGLYVDSFNKGICVLSGYYSYKHEKNILETVSYYTM